MQRCSAAAPSPRPTPKGERELNIPSRASRILPARQLRGAVFRSKKSVVASWPCRPIAPAPTRIPSCAFSFSSRLSVQSLTWYPFTQTAMWAPSRTIVFVNHSRSSGTTHPAPAAADRSRPPQNPSASSDRPQQNYSQSLCSLPNAPRSVRKNTPELSPSPFTLHSSCSTKFAKSFFVSTCPGPFVTCSSRSS